MHKNCDKCGGRCCLYYCFRIPPPQTYEDFDEIRWYLLHERTSVHVDLEGEWFIRIDNRCGLLTDTPRGPRCADYDQRPIPCRVMSPESCDFAAGGWCDYDELFTSADQLDAFARRMLGEQEYLASRDRARASTGRDDVKIDDPPES